jgi:hypothetical protein
MVVGFAPSTVHPSQQVVPAFLCRARGRLRQFRGRLPLMWNCRIYRFADASSLRISNTVFAWLGLRSRTPIGCTSPFLPNVARLRGDGRTGHPAPARLGFPWALKLHQKISGKMRSVPQQPPRCVD